VHVDCGGDVKQMDLDLRCPPRSGTEPKRRLTYFPSYAVPSDRSVPGDPRLFSYSRESWWAIDGRHSWLSR
jgi:hypothetical protein